MSDFNAFKSLAIGKEVVIVFSAVEAAILFRWLRRTNGDLCGIANNNNGRCFGALHATSFLIERQEPFESIS